MRDTRKKQAEAKTRQEKPPKDKETLGRLNADVPNEGKRGGMDPPGEQSAPGCSESNGRTMEEDTGHLDAVVGTVSTKTVLVNLGSCDGKVPITMPLQTFSQVSQCPRTLLTSLHRHGEHRIGTGTQPRVS